MKKWLMYSAAAAVLMGSLSLGVISYEKSLNYGEGADIPAAGVLGFAKALHLADDEHPIHYESGEQPFYEKNVESTKYYYAQEVYRRICVVLVGAGIFLFFVLVHSTSNDPKDD